MPNFREQQSTCIIRWWRMHNYWFINIKRSICCSRIIARRQVDSLLQTGWRFMDILSYFYGMTRRGMTQCISASLLVLDRWSRPNITVPSLILSKACVNFMYCLHWQCWLIGNVKKWLCPLCFACCRSAEVWNDLWLLDQIERIYDASVTFTCS